MLAKGARVAQHDETRWHAKMVPTEALSHNKTPSPHYEHTFLSSTYMYNVHVSMSVNITVAQYVRSPTAAALVHAAGGQEGARQAAHRAGTGRQVRVGRQIFFGRDICGRQIFLAEIFVLGRYFAEIFVIDRKIILQRFFGIDRDIFCRDILFQDVCFFDVFNASTCGCAFTTSKNAAIQVHQNFAAVNSC